MEKFDFDTQCNFSSDQVKNITEGSVDPQGNHIHKSPNELRLSGDKKQKTGIAPKEYGKSIERAPEGLIRRIRHRIMNLRSGRLRRSIFFLSCCFQPATEEDKESRIDQLQDQQVVQQAEEQNLETKKGQFPVSEPIHERNIPKECKIGRFIVSKPNLEDILVSANKDCRINKTKIMKKKRQCVTDNQEATKGQFNVDKQMPKANLPKESDKGRFNNSKPNREEHMVPQNKDYRKSKPKVTKMKRRRMTDLEKNIRFIEKTVWDFDICP